MTPRAIVTGGAQGIGRCIADRLHAEGWQVAPLDIDDEALFYLKGPRAIEADVADEGDVARAIDTLGWDGLDLLVNNAGLADPVSGPLEKLSPAEWRRRIDSHLTSAFLMVRACVQLLRRRRGAIVTMSSTRARQSEPNTRRAASAARRTSPMPRSTRQARISSPARLGSSDGGMTRKMIHAE